MSFTFCPDNDDIDILTAKYHSRFEKLKEEKFQVQQLLSDSLNCFFMIKTSLLFHMSTT